VTHIGPARRPAWRNPQPEWEWRRWGYWWCGAVMTVPSVVAVCESNTNVEWGLSLYHV